jgi:hypothetical protein
MYLFKMSKPQKIYCLKCKVYTETENEDRNVTERGCNFLSGQCVNCGRVKVCFTNEKGTFNRKSVKELAVARIKRKEASLNRRAKKLGREILDADEGVKKGVRKILKEA